ncbi:MAG: DUF3048 domain-containing protein [Acidimicrobiia bacterium]
MPQLSPRQWAVVGGVVAVIVVIIAALALSGGGDEDVAADRETTTTTTEATTTTAAPEPAPGYPLTGLAIDDPARAQRPVLAVKIDNAEPRTGRGGRPQAGINVADVVYEEVVEGSVTRFLALFHSTDADPVGPVRSARTTDLLLMRPLSRPLFAWSGANAGVAGQVRGADLVNVGVDANPGAYYRADDRPAPYDLMSSTGALYGGAASEERPPPSLFSYRAEGEAPAGQPVDGVRIVFGDGPGSAPVEYRWDGQGWARTQRDTPHVDAAGQQVAPPNVVIQLTPYREVQCCDAAGFPIVEAELVGEGDAWILTGGNLVEARWSRPTEGDVTTYTTADGEEVGLTPGRTWVAIAPPGSTTVL